MFVGNTKALFLIFYNMHMGYILTIEDLELALTL